jgi:signal transduction histidine kinase
VSESAPAPDAAELSSAAFDLLLREGELGLIWLDASLTVVAATGQLPAGVLPGEPLGRSLPALFGMEAGITALRDEPHGRRLRLPNVALRISQAEARKVDFEVRWLGSPPLYLVVLLRGADQTVLEVELRREMRARRIAESLLVEKSQQIEVANRDLARVNRDLEEFAYVIAHDLKAPLRAIRITADRLVQQLGAAIGQEPRASLALIGQQSRRMSQMLSGLLEYSRVGRKKEVEAEVDLRALAAEIAASARGAGGIRIEIAEDSWPRFVTLREPLDVVLRNLVENAVKHHDRTEGLVRLHCDDGGDAWILAVEDDGPGIPPGYHAAVFEPFCRIHDDGAGEGSGIGLALVKKIVELVGGTVEIVSDPATRRGSLFRVRWPKTIAG